MFEPAWQESTRYHEVVIRFATKIGYFLWQKAGTSRSIERRQWRPQGVPTCFAFASLQLSLSEKVASFSDKTLA
jgi:hypothetical protein